VMRLDPNPSAMTPVDSAIRANVDVI
jgi:hypothetical protein